MLDVDELDVGSVLSIRSLRDAIAIGVFQLPVKALEKKINRETREKLGVSEFFL